MNKITFALFLLVAIVPVTIAQDVIVKRNADEIEVKVLHVSEKEITYLKWDNQDGPTYTISVESVFYIKYENGSKDVFEINKTNKMVDTNTKEESSTIVRQGNVYYYKGQELRGAAYANFLQENCPSVYPIYQKGSQIASAGWSLLATGGVIDLVGVFITLKNGYSTKGSVVMGCVGGALEIACIPTLIVGYTKMHKATDIFNAELLQNNSYSYFSINASNEGIGLAYHF